MDIQVKLAIISIAVIIPITSSTVWISGQQQGIDDTDDESQITVLTSFFPLYEFTNKIGGNHIDVLLLVPEGIEPHDWEPTVNDIQRIQKADAVVINGIGFENWLSSLDELDLSTNLIDSSFGIKILDFSSESFGEYDEHDEHNEKDEHEELHDISPIGDPHIWLNPILAKKQVENIKNGLIQIDPQNAKSYEENSSIFLTELDELDSKIKRELSKCKKDFVTYHNAFSYFADQYGLQQHTIITTNDPHADPTPKNLEKIINLSRELDVRGIFTEENVESRTSEVIADELGIKVLSLSTLELENINSSYIKKMEENLSNLKQVLCN